MTYVLQMTMCVQSWGCVSHRDIDAQEREKLNRNQASLREIVSDNYEGHPLRIFHKADNDGTYYVSFKGTTDYMQGFVKSAFVRYCSMLITQAWAN